MSVQSFLEISLRVAWMFVESFLDWRVAWMFLESFLESCRDVCAEFP